MDLQIIVPLWCKFERGETEKHVTVIEEMSINEEFLEADILKRIEKLKTTRTPAFEEMKMSDAFWMRTPRTKNWTLRTFVASKKRDKHRLYEDCPMPRLKCEVQRHRVRISYC